MISELSKSFGAYIYFVMLFSMEKFSFLLYFISLCKIILKIFINCIYKCLLQYWRFELSNSFLSLALKINVFLLIASLVIVIDNQILSDISTIRYIQSAQLFFSFPIYKMKFPHKLLINLYFFLVLTFLLKDKKYI